LAANTDDKTFKIYFLDIGLLNYLLGTDSSDILESGDHQESKLMGLMAEQFIAQHLKYLSVKDSYLPLFYWLNDKKKEAAEVDFLIQQSSYLIPIEVKSGQSGKIKSLHFFMAKNTWPLAVRFDLQERKEFKELIRTRVYDGKNMLNSHYQLLNLPLFAIENLYSIISSAIRSLKY
jgi:uncharacterized protein